MTQSTRYRRRGNAVLEAAFVFPVLLLITFGCVEFGHYFFVKHTLQGAAREGARAAAVPNSTDAYVRTVVEDAMKAAGYQKSSFTTLIQNTSTPAQNIGVNQPAGTAISVRVQCRWGTVGARPMGLMDAEKTVVGVTTMRKEG